MPPFPRNPLFPPSDPAPRLPQGPPAGANPGNSQPVHIGHCMMVHPDNLPRFKQHNVIAEFSPAFWFPLPVNNLLPKHVGKERAARAMPVAEMHSAGATVAIGTDWPAGIPTADPLRGLEGLVTRMDPWGEHPGKLGEPVIQGRDSDDDLEQHGGDANERPARFDRSGKDALERIPVLTDLRSMPSDEQWSLGSACLG